MSTRWKIGVASVGALLISSAVAPASADAPELVVARIGDKAITLSEVDSVGGRALYDAAQSLYEARVRALYKILSDEALRAEAAKRAVPVDRLLALEVTGKVPKVGSTDVDAALQGKSVDKTDATLRDRVEQRLLMQRISDRRREYIAALFKEHGLRVSLASPPPPPADEVRGPLTPALGKEAAPVVVTVFSDFQCPWCRQMAGTLRQVADRFPNEVRIVYRHLPLHEDSQRLAEASMCADAQQHFWQYHDALFREPGVRGEQTIEIAKTIGLNVDDFEKCLKDGRFTPRVLADAAEANRLGVNGTPTLFVNGVRINQAVGYDRLAAEVQTALQHQGRSTVAARASGN